MPKFNSSWIERNIYYKKEEGEHEGKPCPYFKQYERPLIICLIGSSRFKEDHLKVQGLVTLDMKIVLPIGLWGHSQLMPDGSKLDMDGPLKKALDELHFHKIDLADEVYVVNPLRYHCDPCKEWSDPYPRVAPICSKCGRLVGVYEARPYIGESTKRELAYAIQQGKTIYYLNPPCPCCLGHGYTKGGQAGPFEKLDCKHCKGKGWVASPLRSITCPDCKGNGFPNGIRVGDSPCDKCNGIGYLLGSAAVV